MSHLLPIIGKSESVKSIPDPPFNEKAPPVKKQLSFSLPDLLLPSHKRAKRKKLDFESSDSLIKSKRRRLQWSSTMPARDSIDLSNNQRQCHEGWKRHLRRPYFSKGLTKLAILPDYECPGLICLALPAHQKFGLILVIKFFLVEVMKK